MDIDANDLLSTNTFIKNPDLTTNIPPDANEQFKLYYEKQMLSAKNKQILKAASNTINLDETTDQFNLLNTHTHTNLPEQKVNRKLTEIKTFVSVDSRDRNRLTFPKPNHFKIFLGKTFYNVRTIRLASIEFPNTDAVINSSNNVISWRNQEDIISDFTVTATVSANNATQAGQIGYPIYSNSLRIGSYIASSLQGEITKKLNLVPRQGGTSSLVSNQISGNFHYFVVTLDSDTDIVTFTSLTLTPLQNNPFSATVGSDLILVTTPTQTNNTNANFFTGNNQVYFVGAKTTAGIDSSYFAGFQNITIVSPTTISFSVNINASNTVQGGGNTVQAGLAAPFQLLWGESTNTVAQNIGFPLENSSEIIYTNISNISNVFQMVIITKSPHNLTRDYTFIGKTISVGTFSQNLFNPLYSFLIMDILNATSLVVLVNASSVASSLNGNNYFIKFGSYTPVGTIEFYNQVGSFLVNFYTPHGYTLSDIGITEVTLVNTLESTVVGDTSYDGSYLISEVPSTTQLVLPGTLIKLNSHPGTPQFPQGLYGNINTIKPLNTHTLTISSIGSYTSTTTVIVTNTVHNLQVGDQITINGLTTVPQLAASYTIVSVINLTTFVIDLALVSYDPSSVPTAIIGTGYVTVYYPSHGFNSIINMSQIDLTTLAIQTTNKHYLSVGQIVRIMQTTTTPSLDNSYLITSIVSPDTFQIELPVPMSVAGVAGATGIIGMNQNFYLYGVSSVGGISSNFINGISFTVREILDANNFSFMIPGAFATSSQQGGGNTVYISSLIHGFNTTQTNTKSDLLNRSINLEGENYAFLTCPQLDTMKNTGSVTNIFARITLDQSPGYICFNFLSEPKQFNQVPLASLAELEFSVVNHNNTLYEFNDLDFSFTLEITEVVDTSDLFNISSKRGVVDIS